MRHRPHEELLVSELCLQALLADDVTDVANHEQIALQPVESPRLDQNLKQNVTLVVLVVTLARRQFGSFPVVGEKAFAIGVSSQNVSQAQYLIPAICALGELV